MKFRNWIAAAALALAATAWSPVVVQGADEAPEDVVRRLLPALDSDVPEAREEAERELFALGTDGRNVLETLAGARDQKVAGTARRLLQRTEWHRSTERKLQPRDGDPIDRRRFYDLQAEMDRLRQRFRDSVSKQFGKDIPRLFNEMDFDVTRGRSTLSGRIEDADGSFTWSRDADGKVSVTVTKPGEDAQTHVADSMEELRKVAPEAAERLGAILKEQSSTRVRIRIPGGLFDKDGVDREWDLPRFEDFPGRERWERSRKRMEEWFRGRDPVPAPAAEGPFLGIEWSLPSELLRAHLDLPEGGMVVDRVLADSLAQRLGLRVHDILTELNGERVSSAAGIRKILADHEAGDPVTASVVRKGKVQSLQTGD